MKIAWEVQIVELVKESDIPGPKDKISSYDIRY